MEDRKAFLRWVVVIVATTAAASLMWMTGLAYEVWTKDASRLSAVIMGFFTVISLVMGRATWRASEVVNPELVKNAYSKLFAEGELRELSERLEVGWFCSELCFAVGMLGTIIGFVMMLSGFETLDMGQATSIQDLITGLGKSMATALYTTLVGLICGTIIKIQCVNLGLEVRSKGGE